jgi:phage/plasmid-like protein (TIGR03299 family)
MAHNLNFNELTGEYSFFSTKQKSWHGLGKVVAGYPTSAEALVFAGLDFDVIKSPLFTQVNGMVSTPDGINYRNISLDIPDTFATVRTDTNQVLGVVGKDYEIVQNRDAFSFFDSIIGGDGILYETAGALGNGSRIFITAKLPGYIRVGDDDLTEKYIFLTTSHDGSGSITGAFTPPALYVTIRLMMR